MKLTKRLLGHVGVDSGQLMITDPCYIGSEWKDKQFQDIRIYKNVKTGQLYQYDSPFYKIKKNKKTIYFNSYEQRLANKQTMNEMLALKQLKEVPVPEKLKLKNTMSYGGICETTIANENIINFRLGHEGAAIVFGLGYGDGYYKVHGYFNKDNRCMKVEIDMN